MKRAILSVIGVSVGFISAVEVLNPTSRIIYNGSASAPTGWYVAKQSDIRKGDYVLTWLPERAQKLANERHYLPPNVPVLKRVFAISNDHICIENDTVFVNKNAVAYVQNHDTLARPLTAWSGCRVLKSDEYFLLQGHQYSFDSRYFGPVTKDHIVTKVMPLWVNELQEST